MNGYQEWLFVMDYLIRFTLVCTFAWGAGKYLMQKMHPMWYVLLLRVSLVGIFILLVIGWMSPGIQVVLIDSAQPHLSPGQSYVAGYQVPQMNLRAIPTDGIKIEETSAASTAVIPGSIPVAVQWTLPNLNIWMCCISVWAMGVVFFIIRMWRSRRMVHGILNSLQQVPEKLVVEM